MLKRQRIYLTGRVQGVGCRPFVHRLATEISVTGFVYNDTRGVTIEIQALAGKINLFIERLSSPAELPPLMKVVSLASAEIPIIVGESKFSIKRSSASGVASSQVTPDIAVCKDCLRELADENNFRYRYPFINCTNCGPRFSIIKSIPYDRPNTTMADFQMCGKCQGQYRDIADRRYHAQPVACPACGPALLLTDNTGKTIESDCGRAIEKTVRLLLSGKIVAIKGIGGFHLAVDALNEQAVKTLRQRKQREHKPFALMAASVEKIREYADVNDRAGRLLQSPQSPIVLLQKKPSAIAACVAEQTDTFGFMLCYAPLHHLLFAQKCDGRSIEVLVMTSANIADEPLICINEVALQKLASIADAFLMNDRQIHRQIDDSIVHFVGSQPVLLRRARGYAPTPILLDNESSRNIFAAGADLKNTFCLVKKNQMILSPHIGDLEDATVYQSYRDSAAHLQQLFQVSPEIVACDLHPAYISSQYAESIPAKKIFRIQHHWAHIASVMAEYNYNSPVIGLAVDGTGFGTDGAVWGCECLIASFQGFERFGHLAYYPLAGADSAAKEPIRPLLGLLRQCSTEGSYLKNYEWLISRIEPDVQKVRTIADQIEKNLNTVQTSSMGRVFDAVAAMLGLGRFNHFEAQLPIALETIADKNISDGYDFSFSTGAEKSINLDLRGSIRLLIDDVYNNVPAAVISAKFHNTVASALCEMAKKAAKKKDINTVALSGGVFCNRFLSARLISLLQENNFCVLFNRHVPANDGGIALGQAAIAAHNLQRNEVS